MRELGELCARHCHRPMTETPIPGLILSRSDCVTENSAYVYHPLLCVVASGRKRLQLGEEELSYDPGTYLVSSLDVPVQGRVVEGPCHGMTLRLDLDKVAALLLEMPSRPREVAPLRGLATEKLEADLRDPLLRLVRLLDEPEHIPVLGPMIENEILYRLLLGPRGAMVAQMALPEGPVAQVQRAIRLIRSDYARPFRVEDLAEASAMSPTSFHRHFRAVTGLSPLQFIKGIRLHEARRLLLSRPSEVSQVALEVGYESASQFSREYRRLFGTPPSQDALRLRESLLAPAAG